MFMYSDLTSEFSICPSFESYLDWVSYLHWKTWENSWIWRVFFFFGLWLSLVSIREVQLLVYYWITWLCHFRPCCRFLPTKAQNQFALQQDWRMFFSCEKFWRFVLFAYWCNKQCSAIVRTLITVLTLFLFDLRSFIRICLAFTSPPNKLCIAENFLLHRKDLVIVIVTHRQE